jgi:hypothetical protein
MCLACIFRAEGEDAIIGGVKYSLGGMDENPDLIYVVFPNTVTSIDQWVFDVVCRRKGNEANQGGWQ